jgi:hypothetical protein
LAHAVIVAAMIVSPTSMPRFHCCRSSRDGIVAKSPISGTVTPHWRVLHVRRGPSAHARAEWTGRKSAMLDDPSGGTRAGRSQRLLAGRREQPVPEHARDADRARASAPYRAHDPAIRDAALFLGMPLSESNSPFAERREQLAIRCWFLVWQGSAVALRNA